MPSLFPSLIYPVYVRRNLKSPTCYKNPSTTKTNKNLEKKGIGTPQGFKISFLKGGGGLGSDRAVGPLVSRSIARRAFEEKGDKKGVRRAPRRPAQAEAHPRKARPGRVPTPQTAQKSGRRVTTTQRSWRGEGWSPAGGKGGTGAIATPRAQPGPPPGSQMFSAGSHGCASTRAARGTAWLPSRSLASSCAPRSQEGTHPGPPVANSRRLPRRQQRRRRLTPGVPAEPSPRPCAHLPRGAASRAPGGGAAL